MKKLNLRGELRCPGDQPSVEPASVRSYLPGTKHATLLPFSKMESSFVDFLLPSAAVSYSVTSSNTMFTNSSKPRSVPTNSLLFFSTIHSFEPTHLSMSSARGEQR